MGKGSLLKRKHRNASSSSSSDGDNSKSKRNRCSRRSVSSSDSPDRKKRYVHKKSRWRKKHYSSSSSNSSSSSSSTNSSVSSSSSSSSSTDSEEERRRKRLKQKKRKIKKSRKKRKQDVKLVEKGKAAVQAEEDANNDVPLELMDRSKTMAPMTKEEWERKQSAVRRVYDEETGRHRLIKGEGEVLEEIVSKDRHKAINREATAGDGHFFQKQVAAHLHT